MGSVIVHHEKVLKIYRFIPSRSTDVIADVDSLSHAQEFCYKNNIAGGYIRIGGYNKKIMIEWTEVWRMIEEGRSGEILDIIEMEEKYGL